MTDDWSSSMRRDMSKSSNEGFTLIEALAAIVIAAAIVAGLGALSERLIHHRVTTDGNSAAMSLAEAQMESLLADLTPNPSSCPGSNLCSGTHTATSGDYNIQWVVVDATTATSSPFVRAKGSTAPVKKITVTVTHARNPMVNAALTRFYDVSPHVAP